MSRVQATKDIAAALQLAIDEHSAYPLEVDMPNFSTISDAMQKDPYLKVEIKFMGAEQKDLGDHPIVEQWGQIWITAVEKCGDGSLRAEALLDFITPYFELRRLGIVQCRSVSAVSPKDINGLWNVPAIVNFHYHRRT